MHVHLDGDIGDESYSGVDEEVPSCDTSCSSSLISIADSESEKVIISIMMMMIRIAQSPVHQVPRRQFLRYVC